MAGVPMIDALEGEPAWNELNDVTQRYVAFGSRHREGAR